MKYLIKKDTIPLSHCMIQKKMITTIAELFVVNNEIILPVLIVYYNIAILLLLMWDFVFVKFALFQLHLPDIYTFSKSIRINNISSLFQLSSSIVMTSIMLINFN